MTSKSVIVYDPVERAHVIAYHTELNIYCMSRHKVYSL